METQLLFAANSPPLAVIAATKLAQISHSLDSSLPSGSVPQFVFSNSPKLKNDELRRVIWRENGLASEPQLTSNSPTTSHKIRNFTPVSPGGFVLERTKL